eukprot:6214691-Pleurochrysis_carterae.AAC.2
MFSAEPTDRCIRDMSCILGDETMMSEFKMNVAVMRLDCRTLHVVEIPSLKLPKPGSRNWQ